MLLRALETFLKGQDVVVVVRAKPGIYTRRCGNLLHCMGVEFSQARDTIRAYGHTLRVVPYQEAERESYWIGQKVCEFTDHAALDYLTWSLHQRVKPYLEKMLAKSSEVFQQEYMGQFQNLPAPKETREYQ